MAAAIEGEITLADNDQQRRPRIDSWTVLLANRSYAWTIAKGSTKGQRQTRTMKPIKCLLLLAAVLAFAAMNAAAMENPGPSISQLVGHAIQNLLAGVPHVRNIPYLEINARMRRAMQDNVQSHQNEAMGGLVQIANFAASRTNLPPRDAYNVRADENVERCHSYSCMDFLKCMNCCTVMGYRNGRRWAAEIIPFMDYRGLCVCKDKPGVPPPPEDVYRIAVRQLDGDVIDPVQ
jgi:hypothetical protein